MPTKISEKFNIAMQPNKHRYLLIPGIVCLLAVFSPSCEKSVDFPIDPQYPTTLYRLGTNDYIHSLVSYFMRNPDVITALTWFGFCGYSGGYEKEYYFPPKNGYTSRAEAIALAKEFIARNPKQTGINDTSAVRFDYTDQDWGYDSTCFWFLRTPNQFVNSMEVLNSMVGFRISNGRLIECIGNWYPEIYVPGTFNISTDKALQNLVGRECGLWGWGGYEPNKVKQSDLKDAEISRVVYPVTDGSYEELESQTKTELRVAYKINLPTAFYIFYIDVMDGRLISSGPTVISK